VGQVFNLRRIFNPPASLGRARRPRLQLAAMWGRIPSCAAIANRRARRLPTGAQLAILPY
jgi:hypothetical protein